MRGFGGYGGEDDTGGAGVPRGGAGAGGHGGSGGSAGIAGTAGNAGEMVDAGARDASRDTSVDGPAREAGPKPEVGPQDGFMMTSGPFKHPGVLLNAAQLALMKEKVASGTQPWKAAYDKAAASPSAALTLVPKPLATVTCGSGSNPNIGCTDERGDAAAAYTQALLWKITGDEARAKKAVEILNAWSILRAHTDSNAPLQAGWSGALFARAAEIMHTYAGWAAADVDAFKVMLAAAFVPLVSKNSGSNGNWELVMIEATIGIAVFTDDRVLFDRALDMWHRRVPAYIYMSTDGPLPVPPPAGGKDTPEKLTAFWNTPGMFVDGLAQESCRDFGHTEWGIAAAVNTAETALQQGIDLYARESARLRAGLEFHAQILTGTPAPAWLCGGTVMLGLIPTWEIAYNHFVTRLGLALPFTKQLIETKVRPSGLNYFVVWETLTHAESGWTGLR